MSKSHTDLEIFKNGVVSEIEITLYITSIEEMIKHFGEPEKILQNIFALKQLMWL